MINLNNFQPIETSEAYKFKESSINQKIVRFNNIYNPDHFISFWHDIPLQNKDGTFNAVIEISRLTVEKYEIDRDSVLPTGENLPHFIKQDINKDWSLREYPIPMLWNYGAFPQTWEDNKHLDPHTNFKGDNDPLDLIDISGEDSKDIGMNGTIIPVIPLGVLGMIDSGETDWKVICIQKEGEKYEQIKSLITKGACLDEINEVLDGEIDLIKLWLTYYKVLEEFKKDQPKSVNLLKKELEDPYLSNKAKIGLITTHIDKIDQQNACFNKKIKFYGIDIDPDSGHYFYDTNFKLSFSNLNPFHHKSPFNNVQLAIKIIDENYQHWYHHKRPK